MRLIDADALCEECKGSIIKCVGTGCRVPTMQTIEVEPVKHGRWIDIREAYNDVPQSKCSLCGCKIIGLESRYNYCPNCGAKMDLEETE